MDSNIDVSSLGILWFGSGPDDLGQPELIVILELVRDVAAELMGQEPGTARAIEHNGLALFVEVTSESEFLVTIDNRTSTVTGKFSFSLDPGAENPKPVLGVSWRYDDPKLGLWIADLDLPLKVKNTLAREGVLFVGQLVRLSNEQLDGIHLFGGQESIDAVDAALGALELTRKTR